MINQGNNRNRPRWPIAMKSPTARLCDVTAERNALRAELAECNAEVEFREALRVELREALDVARTELARALRELAGCKAKLAEREANRPTPAH